MIQVVVSIVVAIAVIVGIVWFIWRRIPNGNRGDNGGE